MNNNTSQTASVLGSVSPQQTRKYKPRRNQKPTSVPSRNDESYNPFTLNLQSHQEYIQSQQQVLEQLRNVATQPNSSFSIQDHHIQTINRQNEEITELTQRLETASEQRDIVIVDLNREKERCESLRRNRDSILKQKMDLGEELDTAKRTIQQLQSKIDTLEGNQSDYLASLSCDQLEELGDKLASMQKNVIRALTQKMQAHTICDICFDNEKNTCLSPCGHVFCSVCIQAHTRQSNNTCPKCRAVFTGKNTIYL